MQNKFKTGDLISYPAHGQGRIDSIVKKRFLSQDVEFLNIKLDNGLTVLVPIKDAKDIGVKKCS